MNAIAAVRAHVGDALSGLPATVHLYPPGTVTPPAVVLLPADPYWAGDRLAGVRVGLLVRLITSAAAGPDGHAALDDLIDAAAAALQAAGVQVDPVDAPTLQTDGTTLVADLATFTSWED